MIMYDYVCMYVCMYGCMVVCMHARIHAFAPNTAISNIPGIMENFPPPLKK